MIDIYDEEIEYNKKVCPRIPKDAPRHKEFATIQIIRNELQESLNLEIDKEYNTSKYISVFASQLILIKNLNQYIVRNAIQKTPKMMSLLRVGQMDKDYLPKAEELFIAKAITNCTNKWSGILNKNYC